MSRLTIALLDILSYLLDFRSCFFYHYSVDGKSMQSIKNGLFRIAPFLPQPQESFSWLKNLNLDLVETKTVPVSLPHLCCLSMLYSLIHEGGCLIET